MLRNEDNSWEEKEEILIGITVYCSKPLYKLNTLQHFQREKMKHVITREKRKRLEVFKIG